MPEIQHTMKVTHQLEEACVNDCSARQSGRAVIKDIIHRLRRKADDLEKLSDMLPANPTPEQDQALWSIACGLER